MLIVQISWSTLIFYLFLFEKIIFVYFEGLESDDEIRRVPEIGGEAAGMSGSGRETGSITGLERVQGSADGSRKRGRSPAEKENKRLKR